MPCQPLDPININPPSTIVPGFVPQLPSFDLPIPAIPIEDLENLFSTLAAILPPGTLRPHLSPQFSKDVIDAILSILEKFMPFLMLYTFFMPILNLLLCIIEILCSLNNPVKLVRAMIRLFRVCIPEFLSLFPFFALILMIISLLLLILALILYLLQRIIAFIEQIIRNIIILGEAIASADNDSVIAIVAKLGDLLCIFQNLFVLLGVILLIFELIDKLRRLSFKLPPCSSDDTSDDGCCTPDVCPSFIKNNKTISSSTGTLQYFNNVIQTGGSLGPVYLRHTSLQIFDGYSTTPLQFNNITHAFDLPPGVTKVFFPEGETYEPDTTPNSVPYTIDVRFFYDPAVFSRVDTKGARFIRIKDCIVLTPPTDGVLNYNNAFVAPFNGTLLVGGGTAFEDDGITVMKVQPTDASPGTLNTVIALPDEVGTSPVLLPTDGLQLNLSYDFKINQTILVGKDLITLGCHPDVALNRDFINNTIASRLNINAEALLALTLPDVLATQNCVIDAVSKFRSNVSVDTANELQTTVVNCLNTLQNQTNQALQDVINAGFDPYNSTFSIDPSIQFTTKPINVSVILNESGGNNIASNIPASVAANLASNITANITLGNIGNFVYDGYSQFIADLTSDVAGNGTIKVAYSNQFISVITNPTDTTQSPSVAIKELLYTFVQSPLANAGIGSDAGEVRRDAGDVSRDGG